MKKQKQTDESLVAEGLAAYTAGQPKSANPYGNPNSLTLKQEVHHKAFLWHMGWGQGHFAEHGGKGVPVYTGIPANCTPQMVDKRELPDVHERREHARLLPWTMDQLIGSVWVNLYTGRIETIIGLYCNRFGQPQPGWNWMYSDVYIYINGPGVWLETYIVDHWMRFDTMEPTLQELWKDRLAQYEFKEIQRNQSETTQKNKPDRVKAVVNTPTTKQAERSHQQLTLF